MTGVSRLRGEARFANMDHESGGQPVICTKNLPEGVGSWQSKKSQRGRH